MTTRAEQLRTYYLKFLEFVDGVLDLSEASSQKIKDTLSQMKDAPTVLVCGMAQTLIEKHGKDLKDMSGVFKMMGDYSDALMAQGLAESTLKAINYLESHPDIKDKFFRYIDVIMRIMG